MVELSDSEIIARVKELCKDYVFRPAEPMVLKAIEKAIDDSDIPLFNVKAKFTPWPLRLLANMSYFKPWIKTNVIVITGYKNEPFMGTDTISTDITA